MKYIAVKFSVAHLVFFTHKTPIPSTLGENYMFHLREQILCVVLIK